MIVREEPGFAEGQSTGICIIDYSIFLFYFLLEIKFKIVGIFETSDPQPARTTK